MAKLFIDETNRDNERERELLRGGDTWNKEEIQDEIHEAQTKEHKHYFFFGECYCGVRVDPFGNKP